MQAFFCSPTRCLCLLVELLCIAHKENLQTRKSPVDNGVEPSGAQCCLASPRSSFTPTNLNRILVLPTTYRSTNRRMQPQVLAGEKYSCGRQR